MHCPDGINGCEYIELIAATAIVISQDLDSRGTFLLAEFLQAVSCQLVTLAFFKEKEESNKKSRDKAAHT
jgi:hypothetical protein